MISDHARVRDEKGTSAVEFGLLIAGFAALVVIVILFISKIGDGLDDNRPLKTTKSAEVSHATSAPTPGPNTDPRKNWVVVFGSDDQTNTTGFTVLKRCDGTRLIIVTTSFNGGVAQSVERNSDDCL